MPLYPDGPEYVNQIDIESMDYYLDNVIYEFEVLSNQINHPSGFYMEAASKENIFKRIWNLIIGLLKKLKAGINFIINKIKGFFQSRKKSMYQILEECGIHPKAKHTNEAVAPASEKVVHFYATKGSDLNETDIKLLVNHLYIKIISGKCITKAPGIDPGLSLNGPHRSNNWMVNFYAAAYLMENLSASEMLFEIADMIVYDESKGGLLAIQDGFIKKVQQLDSMVYNHNTLNKLYNAGGIAWNIRDLMNFQKRLSFVTSKIDKVKTVEGISDDLLKALNQFADFLVSITIGLNEFNRAVNNVYMIDDTYLGAIDNAVSLDAFVYRSIKEGIPYKYIAYNTWLLLNDKWKANTKEFYTSRIEPKWGQMRTVFDLKDKDVVLKLAMSNGGILCNHTEIAITKEFTQKGVDNLIAPVLYAMKYAAAIFPESIVTYKLPDDGDLYEYKSKLDDLYWDHPELHDIREDIHLKNIGFNQSGNIVCIDYGNSKITKGVK